MALINFRQPILEPEQFFFRRIKSIQFHWWFQSLRGFEAVLNVLCDPSVTSVASVINRIFDREWNFFFSLGQAVKLVLILEVVLIRVCVYVEIHFLYQPEFGWRFWWKFSVDSNIKLSEPTDFPLFQSQSGLAVRHIPFWRTNPRSDLTSRQTIGRHIVAVLRLTNNAQKAA